jgi:hypothetical protein
MFNQQLPKVIDNIAKFMSKDEFMGITPIVTKQ